MKKTLSFLTILTIAFNSYSQCSDLFISEYIEGSSSNKALEIYNPTNVGINLSDYTIYRNNNGAQTPSDSLFPAGNLASGDVYVIGNPSANSTITSVSDTLHTLTFYNGDDAVWLKNNVTGDTIDVIGIIGVDPGSGWTVGTGATNNTTLVRKIGVQQGSTDWSTGVLEWDVFPIDMDDSLGTHNMNPCCSGSASTINISACNSYVSPSGNYTWTSSNTYTDTVLNVNSCDSIITINLTINTPVTGVDTRTECNSYTWIDGVNYTSNNNTATFNIVGGASNGCDSLVTLDLTINSSSTGVDTRTECNSYTWIDGINYTSNNNTATHNIVGGASNGCDSLVTLDLTIISSTTGVETRTECSSYTWIDGINYTSSNNTATFNIVGGASNGCDSLVTLDLTVIPASTGIESRTECNSYTWIDGVNYTSSNNTATFNIVGGASNGCDSIVTLDLTINNVTDLTTSTSGVTINANNSNATYKWLDCDNNHSVISGEVAQSYTATVNGNYAVELTENGCVDTTSCVLINSVGVLENNFGKNFVVYPNPTKGNISIDLGDDFNSVSTKLTDINGKLIQSKEYYDSQMLNVNIEGPKGVYFLSIVSENNSAIIRLIKE